MFRALEGFNGIGRDWTKVVNPKVAVTFNLKPSKLMISILHNVLF